MDCDDGVGEVDGDVSQLVLMESGLMIAATN